MKIPKPAVRRYRNARNVTFWLCLKSVLTGLARDSYLRMLTARLRAPPFKNRSA